MSNISNATPPAGRKVTFASDPNAMMPYVDAGCNLTPLNGKVPIYRDWTKRSLNAAKLVKLCRKKGYNVGVVLTDTQLVIDVDPRNGGEDGWTNLCFEYGIDEAAFPPVTTGGGGKHFYMTLPAGTRVVDTLKDFQGVEFKSKGRQVVAAGSIHPETGRPYVWDEGGVPLADAPPCPAALLADITRPVRDAAPCGGGQLDQEQAATILDAMDVMKYTDHDRWLKLMMALHHATGGDARQEWIDWSIGDPEYANDADWIGRRWDSLHTARAEGVVTIGTLRLLMHEDGVAHAIPPDQEGAAEEFSGFEPDEDGEDDDNSKPVEKSGLEMLNDRHCAVFSDGRYRIMHREGNKWAAAAKADFISRYENQFIENGKEGKGTPRQISLGKAWQEWPDRKTADGTTFDPASPPSSLVGGALNLWSGFGVEAKPGSWERFHNMIRDDLCDGNAEVLEYVINWTAWKFQNPGRLPETSIVFGGKKGTGKTTYGETVVTIFGEHGIAVDSIDQIAGRFNGHLETKCFAYADEAFWGGDKRNEAGIKKLITDRTATYEYKGVDIFDGVNHIGLVSGGNEAWLVPASMDERRFCVSKVSEKHRVPIDAPATHPLRKYWNRIHHELDHGGRSAFLYDLLNRNLNSWHPRTAVPYTAAMGEQKLHGLTGVSKWWYEILRDGLPPDARTESQERVDWANGPVRMNPTKVTAAYCTWFHYKNPYANPSSKAVLTELREWGWEGGEAEHREPTKERDRYWLMPSLKDGRAMFAERIGMDPF